MPWDPSGIIHEIQNLLGAVQGIQYAIDPRHWLLNVFAESAFGELWKRVTGLIVTTVNTADGGDFTGVAAIKRYEPLTRTVADGGLVAVASWSGYRLMWTQSYRSRYSAHIVLPRLLLAAVLINFAVPLVQLAVDFNNALCQTVLDAQGEAVFRGFLGDLFGGAAKDLGSGPGLTVITTAALLIGYLVLGVGYFVRYALLVILTVTAPLAALAFILPETHRFAREWGSLFTSTLLMQPIQLLILAIAFALEAEGGLPFRHAYSLCALWIAWKVPGALHSVSSLGTHATSTAKRKVEGLIKAAAKGVA